MSELVTDKETAALHRKKAMCLEKYGLESLKDGSRPVYLYGAGEYGFKACCFNAIAPLRDSGVLKGYIDDNPAAVGPHGLPVFSPEEIARKSEDPLVLISVAYRTSNYYMVELACHKFGFDSMPALQFDILLDASIPDIGFFRSDEGREARRALGVWRDQTAQDAYRTYIRSRYFLSEAAVFYSSSKEPQYFVKEIPLRHFRNFVDCGAFDGDTYCNFTEYVHGDFDNYYAIEPDPALFGKFSAAGLGDDNRVCAYNVLLGKEQGTAFFNSSDLTSYCPHVTDGKSGVEMAVTSLDNLFSALPVSMIKMDIEGSEMGALEGAVELIKSQRPALAISIYHGIQDSWQIPLFIHDLQLDYQLFCRSHNWYFTEFVCYALPGE